MDSRIQLSSLDARNNISNMLSQLRAEIQRLLNSGAFSPDIVIKPEKRAQPQWGQLLINLAIQLQSLLNPMVADTTVYNTLLGGGVAEGFEILFKNDVLVRDDVYKNLYNMIAIFINTYGQMLQNVVLQAQYMNYGRKGKCKGKGKCKCKKNCKF